MSQMGITLFFFFIVGVIALAMIVHGWIDKKRISKNFLQLSEPLSGRVVQESRFFYPRFAGEIEGRQVDLFFEVVKVGRKHILYYIYSLKSEITCSLLLLKSDEYKAGKGSAEAIEAAGTLVSEAKDAYEIRTQNEAEASAIIEGADLKERLTALDEFSSLQLGPDALVVGKPYDGIADTESVNIMKNVRALVDLAKAMEKCQVPA